MDLALGLKSISSATKSEKDGNHCVRIEQCGKNGPMQKWLAVNLEIYACIIDLATKLNMIN